jgi:tRNA-splicing ligase RtcB
MKARELENLGIPRGEAMRLAVQSCARASEAGLSREALRAAIAGVIVNPSGYVNDPVFDRLAAELLRAGAAPSAAFVERAEPAPFHNWGQGLRAGLEPEAINQMQRACRLGVSVAGALMPDAHVGYGLPIGGVLATHNAVIPYAVGVDIACRMRLSVFDLPASELDSSTGQDRLTRAIERETCFGVGGSFSRPREHAVMDADWSVSPVTAAGKSKAWNQLGTSGSGNHFVEFGVLTVTPEQERSAGVVPEVSGSGHGSGWRFRLPAGTYLALLSHSGSRGTGAAVCDRYSKLAMSQHPELPKDLKFLAWLDLNTQEGQEYWNAMNLMGEYAAANHEVIHRHIARNLGAQVIAHVENHHNFAWKERHVLGEGGGEGGGEREVIVHRKGATPAGENVLGVIPGSMASPGFVVRGRGGPASARSLRSASHGAGRVMSRTKARETFAWGNVRRDLEARNIRVLSAGIDEAPGVYKDIHEVMALQQDLVEPIARFDPRLVKMAPEGERAED